VAVVCTNTEETEQRPACMSSYAQSARTVN